MLFAGLLIVATLLTSLVAGFLFAFAAVIMPGLARLEDREYLRGFQVIDGVIQRGQPLFMIVWLGSAVLLVTAAVASIWQLPRAEMVLLMAAAVANVVGVQVPTMVFNIPRNNAVQALDLDAATDESLVEARAAFEPGWNRWNVIRTVVSIAVTAVLLVLVRV